MPADLNRLASYEDRIYSQNGEDGVTLALVQDIPAIPSVAVEFGVGDGRECCTRVLREMGWRCFWFDAEHGGGGIHKVRLTAENINAEFERAGVPDEVGVLAIDVDGIDYWLWRALGTRAHVAICEVNSHVHGPVTVAYDAAFRWDGQTDYFGCSLDGMTRLAARKGLGLVYVESVGANAFFVRGMWGTEPDAARRTPKIPRKRGAGLWQNIWLNGEPVGEPRQRENACR